MESIAAATVRSPLYTGIPMLTRGACIARV
jgi:hypothetical protein